MPLPAHFAREQHAYLGGVSKHWRFCTQRSSPSFILGKKEKEKGEGKECAGGGDGIKLQRRAR